ncbi:MAG: hypothetical protein H6819_12000 [Phycisphaerales bacterium]|nr:hypothetical protein [Phycisphaerales bacterium]MCB9858048.1 hypothetical protein [Phycisphaerales bacterium]MCB9864145.1 hypothetical protein [Phycisphaerales bacterium]
MKVIISAVCLVAAIGIWYWSGSTERRLRAELIDGAKDMTYRVECTACGYVGEMNGSEFVRGLDDTGLSVCPKCGESSLRQVGLAGSDPEQFRAEVDAMDSVSEVEEAAYSAQGELDKVILELAAEPKDPERMNALQRERAKLEAKLQALNIRWSTILDPSQVRDQ